MKIKTIILDGGPADGQMVQVYEHETVYECFTPPKIKGDEKPTDPIPPPVKHIYKEDPNVKGHFIYAQ